MNSGKSAGKEPGIPGRAGPGAPFILHSAFYIQHSTFGNLQSEI
jgi:hypothetical protein